MKSGIKLFITKALIVFCLISYVLTYITSDIEHLPTLGDTGRFMLHSAKRTCHLILYIIGDTDDEETEIPEIQNNP